MVIRTRSDFHSYAKSKIQRKDILQKIRRRFTASRNVKNFQKIRLFINGNHDLCQTMNFLNKNNDVNQTLVDITSKDIGEGEIALLLLCKKCQKINSKKKGDIRISKKINEVKCIGKTKSMRTGSSENSALSIFSDIIYSLCTLKEKFPGETNKLLSNIPSFKNRNFTSRFPDLNINGFLTIGYKDSVTFIDLIKNISLFQKHIIKKLASFTFKNPDFKHHAYVLGTSQIKKFDSLKKIDSIFKDIFMDGISMLIVYHKENGKYVSYNKNQFSKTFKYNAIPQPGRIQFKKYA